VNTAIFSMTVEFLMSQPSVRDASTIAYVRLGGNSHAGMAQFQFLRDAKALPDVAGLREEGYLNWRTGDETQRLFAMRATDNLFEMAGIPLHIGRGMRPGDEDAVVISYGMWQGRLASDPAVVGRTLNLDGKPHTVLGVLPENHRTLFGMGLRPDLYAQVRGRDIKVQLYARMPDGISDDAVRERLRSVAVELDKAMPERLFKFANDIRVQRVVGLQRTAGQKSISLFFAVLMTVVSLLLGIACLNVSGLLLARASSRGQEFAIRASLGAGRGRLLRQMLTESLLLPIGGTLLGLILNVFLTHAISRIHLPLSIPIVLQIEPDGRLLAYASAIAGGCALLVGLLPAWRASRSRAGYALKQSEHQVSGKLTLRRGLVVAQVATSIVVLTTAGLFARNLMQSVSLSPGFDLEKTRERRIVVVVRDSKYAWLNDHQRPAMFGPYVVDVGGYRSAVVQFMVRAGVDPGKLARPVRRAMLDLDPTATVEVKPMREAIGMALLPSRMGAGLLSVMGVLGLTLTGIGLYGLMAYSVARRVREIGLRVALGAAPGRVLRLVFGEGAWLVGVGLAIGLAASFFVTRPLARFLVEGISTADPLTYLAVSVLMILAGWVACAIPARRALRIEPMEALRYE